MASGSSTVLMLFLLSALLPWRQLHAAGAAELMLPVYRLGFVAPTDKAASVVNYQVFKHSGVYSLSDNSSLAGGRPDVAYCTRLVIGTPGQNLTAVLDTGSADFVLAGAAAPSLDHWFQAAASRSLAWQQQQARRPYVAGFWEGHLATDVVSVVSNDAGRVIAGPVRADFAVAERSSAFFDAGGGGVWQAAVGLAFDRLASGQTASRLLIDVLSGQSVGAAPAAFALQLCRDSGGSFMSIGRANRTGMTYAPVRHDWYYEVVIVDMKLNGYSLGMDCKEFNFDKAIIHSGVGDIRLPARVHARIAEQLGDQMPQLGRQFFNGVTILCPQAAGGNASAELLAAFPSITFSLLASDSQTVDLRLAPEHYLRQPAASVSANLSHCYRFGLQSSTTGTVLGSAFLEGFLVEFDRAAQRVGFAQSTCGSGVVSGPVPFSVAPRGGGSGLRDCAFFRTDDNGSPVLRPAAIAMATVCVMCVLPVLALLVWRQAQRPSCGNRSNEEGETVQLVPA